MTLSWWEARGALRRFVVDLVADELARQRRTLLPPSASWTEALALDADLGVDSLELLALATALAEALHLHESGIEDSLLARRTVGDWIDVAQAGLERFSARLTFRTSGSTGVAKPCVHTLASLWQETAHLANLCAGRTRVLAAVPAHHLYGFLFTILLPQALGLQDGSVVDLRHGTPAWLARGAREGDLVVGHPDFWAAVARTVPAWQGEVWGVTSTAPCPQAVAESLQAAGLARLLQVYGASETGGIGARDSHDAPYLLFPHWRRQGGGELLERELPEGGRHAFSPQDALVFADERRFTVGARHDAAVQVGGINVFPARVREVLARHPAVADAAVRLMRPDEGTRLKAFVVAHPWAGGDLLQELQAWIARQLTPPERPKAIRLGAALPVGATGKPADWNLQD